LAEDPALDPRYIATSKAYEQQLVEFLQVLNVP
jgi:hypothetical protein